MAVSVRVYNDLREEISVLRGLIDQALDDGVGRDGEPLLQAYVDTLHKREQLLADLEEAEFEAL